MSEGNEVKPPSNTELRYHWEKEGRALDWDIATKVMGWKVGVMPGAYNGHFQPYLYWYGRDAPDNYKKYNPTQDLNLCAKAELQILAADRGPAYIAALREEYNTRFIKYMDWDCFLIAAPALTRCTAMLKAMEAQK